MATSRKRPVLDVSGVSGVSKLHLLVSAGVKFAKIARSEVGPSDRVVDQYMDIINEMRVEFLVVSKNRNSAIHNDVHKFVKEAYMSLRMPQAFEDMWEDVMREDGGHYKLMLLVWKRVRVMNEHVKILGFTYGSSDTQNKFMKNEGVKVHEIKMIFMDTQWRQKIHLGSILLWVFCTIVRQRDNDIKMFAVELPTEEMPMEVVKTTQWKLEEHSTEAPCQEEMSVEEMPVEEDAEELLNTKTSSNWERVGATMFFKIFGFEMECDCKMLADIEKMEEGFGHVLEKMQKLRPLDKMFQQIAIKNDVKNFFRCKVKTLVLSKLLRRKCLIGLKDRKSDQVTMSA